MNYVSLRHIKTLLTSADIKNRGYFAKKLPQAWFVWQPWLTTKYLLVEEIVM